jgi:hypothetical protein
VRTLFLHPPSYDGGAGARYQKEDGWLAAEDAELLTEQGTQIAPLSFPHLSHGEIFASVEEFYRGFYLRPAKIASLLAEMLVSPALLARRLRAGAEFFQFLRSRRNAA